MSFRLLLCCLYIRFSEFSKEIQPVTHSLPMVVFSSFASFIVAVLCSVAAGDSRSTSTMGGSACGRIPLQKKAQIYGHWEYFVSKVLYIKRSGKIWGSFELHNVSAGRFYCRYLHTVPNFYGLFAKLATELNHKLVMPVFIQRLCMIVKQQIKGMIILDSVHLTKYQIHLWCILVLKVY